MTNLLEQFGSRELGIIDLHQINLDDEQIWLYQTENSQCGDYDQDIDDFLNKFKCVDTDTDEYHNKQKELIDFLDQNASGAQKQKFDSRTFTRPKKRMTRPTLPDNMIQGKINNYSLSGTKTITKHRFPSNSDSDYDRNDLNSTFEVATHDSFEEMENNDVLEATSYIISKPIDFKLSEPSNYHTFNNRYIGSIGSQSDSFTNISPPSLVSSITMDGSGTFSRQGSLSTKRGTGKERNDSINEDGALSNSIYSSMTTSILDDKEMSTSFLSQAENLDNQSSHMIDSVDFNLINSSMYESVNRLSQHREMESSLINSGTFNNMVDSIDDKSLSNRSIFNLRRSFLNSDSDDNKTNKYNKLSKCNTDDLQNLASDLLTASEKQENLNNTFQINDKENVPEDDSFLLNDGMSDSFVKSTGRESLNITFNKRLSMNKAERNLKKLNELDETVLLPNQIQNQYQSNLLTQRKSNGSYSPKNTPKRNATFRKHSPDKNIDADMMKSDEYDDIDSNKEYYDDSNQNDTTNVIIENNYTSSLHNKKDIDEKQMLEGRAMVGSSSDSLEGSSSSERSPPQPTTVPLNMEDLEYLAYQQQQSLYTDISTPLPSKVKSKTEVFQSSDLSPIQSYHREALSSSTYSNKSNSSLENKKYGTYRLNSSSTGSLNKSIGTGSTPTRRASYVKRESSAPEIAPDLYNTNIYNTIAKKLSPRSPTKMFGSDSGLNTTRSVTNSPAKTLYGSRLNQMSGLNRPIKLLQNSGSTNELRQLKSGLPASKLRQYSSHKELNRIPGPQWTAPTILRPSSRGGFHSSNPSLNPKPLVRTDSYTITGKDGILNNLPVRNFVNTSLVSKEVNVNYRSDELTSKLTNIHINNRGMVQYGEPVKIRSIVPSLLVQPTRSSLMQPPASNIQSNFKVPSSRQTITTSNSNLAKPTVNVPAQPTANSQQRLPKPSGLPRPSSGIPRKPSLRPPSTYSLAPRPNDQADYY